MERCARGCLSGYELQQDETKFIILKNIGRDCNRYIARQVLTALELLPKLKELKFDRDVGRQEIKCTIYLIYQLPCDFTWLSFHFK